MQRIIPFVDHEIGYRLLHKLIAAAAAGRFEIPAVVTTLENGHAWWPGVESQCKQAEIPLLRYVAPFSSTDLIQNTDWFLLLSWKHLIPRDLINLPTRGVLNLHYSLLPDLRGVYPVNWAIIEGKNTTGVTFHFVDEQIDHGAVFMQFPTVLYLSDTARTLQARLDELTLSHFDDFLERLLAHEGRALIGSSIMDPDGNYYSRSRFEKACAIDLEKYYRGADLINLLRGLTFFEESKNAYIVDNATGRKIYLSLQLREES